MPVLFIHGVYTRQPEFSRLRQLRDQLIKDHFLSQLGEPFSNFEIFSPYWGDEGVAPDLVSETFATYEKGVQLGPNLNDPTIRFLESFSNSDDANCDEEIVLEAFLESLIGTWEGSDFQNVSTIISLVGDLSRDDEFKAVLKSTQDLEKPTCIQQEIVRRLASQNAAQSEPQLGTPSAPEIAMLLEYATVQFRARIESMAGAAKRALTGKAGIEARKRIGNHAFMFLGDAMKYLASRGTPDAPGAILKPILDVIDRNNGDEEWLAITHSMGGNIFFDILKTYRPELSIRAWSTVGSQVGFFERLEAFGERNDSPGECLKGRVDTWVNVYDPIDPFAFKAEPVFGDRVTDFSFNTSASLLPSHGAYFTIPRFYEKLASRILENWGNANA